MFVSTENSMSHDVILRDTFKFKCYNRYKNVVYVCPELNSMDAKKQNGSLKERRDLIESSENKLTSKEIKIVTLEVFENRKNATFKNVLLMSMKMIQAAQQILKTNIFNFQR